MALYLSSAFPSVLHSLPPSVSRTVQRFLLAEREELEALGDDEKI
jgi:hypothetical protein